MYIKTSVRREEGSPGAGIQTRDALTLIDVDDVLYMPDRDSRGVAIEEDIILRPGRYAYTLYMTPGTVEVAEPLEGETDQEGFTPSVKFNHPGNSQAIREFKVNNVGRKFITIVRYCSGKPADIMGDLCNPMKMQNSFTGNNDSSTNEFTFAQTVKGKGIGIYKGTVPGEEPLSVVDAAATSVQYVGEGQYQLSAGEASITAIEGGTPGAVITLCGVAGAAPVVKNTDGKILLKGEDITLAEGCQLTLKAFKSAAEGQWLWIEQSRYEV